MKQRMYRIYGIAILVITLGISFQWLLFSGSSPLNTFFRPGNTHSVVLSSRVPLQRPNFQTGLVFPRWGTTAYSPQDTNWSIGLQEIQQQTSAQWIELTI